LPTEMRVWPSCVLLSTSEATMRTRPLTSPAPASSTRAGWPTWSFDMRLAGTSPCSSTSPLTMMRNSGSARADAIMPTRTKRWLTMPAAGARTVEVVAGPNPSGRDKRASTCPEVTRSPSSTRICDTCRPSVSGRTSTSSRGTRMPLTCRTSVKQVRLALVTVTAMPTGALLAWASAAAGARTSSMTAAPRSETGIKGIRGSPSNQGCGPASPAPRAAHTGVRRGAPRRLGRSAAPADDLVGRHRPMESLERQIADVIGLDLRLDESEDALADEDLAALGLVAQPRRQVGDAADRRIVEALVEADLTERGIADRNAHAEAERMAAPAPDLDEAIQLLAHVERHAYRALGMIGTW